MSAMPQLPAPNDPERPRPLVAARVSPAVERETLLHPLGPLRPSVIRWPLVVVCVVLFSGAGYYTATQRSPEFTSTATVNVGRTDVRVQALPGYVQGAQALAASYSRVVTSDRIVDPVASRLGLSSSDVKSRLTASPIPSAPIFEISARGSDEKSAIALAEAATRETQTFVSRTDRGDTSTSSLLKEYRQQARLSSSLQSQMDRLRADITNGDGNARVLRERLIKAQTDQQTAELRKQSLQSMYVDRASTDTSTAGIQVLSPATSAASDRDSMKQKLVAVGAIAGLLVGLALSALVARRRPRRRRVPV